MGIPKHLLQLPDGRPLYQRLIDILLAACPEAREVCVSLARDSVTDDALHTAAECSPINGRIKVIHDLEENATDTSAGPAAGLLAAHHVDSQASWLVLACDYPFATSEALRHLRWVYAPPVTCFINNEGFCEPLVGIWSPPALRHLAQRVREGSSGPSRTVQEQQGVMIKPPSDQAMLLYNVNTKDEWNLAVRQLKTNPLFVLDEKRLNEQRAAEEC
jgi:molybdenum cofactor guanylyltransferase